MIRLIGFTAAILCFNFIQCYGTDSGEVNRGENAIISPIYDAIVFNDIADIINELDNPNGGNSLIEAFINSVESQSDENIEDLLSEYQHYLDKARKQRKQYFDKTKQLKNKVPTLRRDPYFKKKLPVATNYESLYFANNVYSPNEAKYPQSYYNPIEVLIPLDSRNRFFIDAPQTMQTKVDSKYDDNVYPKVLSKQRLDAPPSYHPYNPPKEPNMSSCYCKTNVIPCECDCAQCIVPPEMIMRNQIENRNKYHGDKESSENFNNEIMHDSSDDSFNIRIKVDIQLPKSQDFAAPKHKNRRPSLRLDNSKEIVSNSVHLPLQYLNFPVPMQIFGLNKGSKNSKIENPQSHKLLIHKKKKSKTGPNNKKHRKKIISFHNIKPELRPKIIPIFGESINITNNQTIKNNETIAPERKLTNVTKKDQTMISSNLTNNITTISTVSNLVNETQTEENINLNVKLMVMNENVTENSSRFENNIDSGLDDIRIERSKLNASDLSEKLPRKKREVSQDAKNFKLPRNNKNHGIKNVHNIKNSRLRNFENITKKTKVKSSNFQNNKSTKHANSNNKGHVTKIQKKKAVTKIKRDGLRNGISKSGNIDKKTKTSRLAKLHDIKEATKRKGEGNKKSGHLKTAFQHKKSSPHSKGASKIPNKKNSQAYQNTKRSKLNIGMDDKFLEHNVRGIQKNAKRVQKRANPETPSKTQTKKTPVMKRVVNKNKAVSKQEKNLFLDTQLLYWPSHDKKPIALGIMKKNITSLILEREHQKPKVNISVEVIRQNHTKALEKAVFGDVDWDDVDTIAPIFMSFVGKYIKGILTMCSQTVCHSMNCANKVCVHRICVAKDRVNNGHCIGNNGTESAVSLESIMDLPSNIPFTVVDILREKMLGKLFGKLTLCLSSKCVTLAIAKKNFMRMKCSTKDLNSGHCPNLKKV